ncbi:hypothetical protein EMCRGX_G004476 [Ephydatia muelleri]
MGCGAGSDSQSRPADVLVPNWDLGKPAAFDLSVTSTLQSSALLEASVTVGSAAQLAENRKHNNSDKKCDELGWACIPLVVETYGCWGAEAVAALSKLAGRLSVRNNEQKSKTIFSLYSRLGLTLVKANCRAILSSLVLFSACAHAQCATSIVQFLRPELYVYVLLNLLYYTGDEGGMAKFGHLQEFDTDLEPITAYLERVELYFSANGIGEDKKLAILLSVIGPKTYGVLRNLLAPSRPQEKKFTLGNSPSAQSGKMRHFKATLKLLPDVQPKFHRPRPVPFALKEAVERELDRLEEAGVIEKVTHCEWAAPVVVVPKKNGTVRLCGDYKVSINQALMVDQYPLPKPSDLFAALSGGKWFTKLDLAQAYTQMELDEVSRQFVAINTHRGLYRIDANGIHATGEKLDAVLMAPVPSSVPQLRSFLGMINYYSKFIPNLATLLNPLNELLRKDVQWKWTDQREQAFKQAKQCLTSPNVLVHYDPTLPIKLAGDASAYGIGAVISHTLPDGSERPIAFASRTLNASERNYAQLEKEALSLIFGVKKFHEYLYGRRFTLLTDHKPLTTILGPKTGVPPLAAARLQRWALLLSAYEYDLEFRPTAQHANADGLSRLPLSIIADAGTATSDSDVFNVGQIEALPVTAMQLRKVTRQDPILSKVVTFTRNGWPSIVPENLKPYWTRRNELTVEGDCLMWGIRVVVPAKLQEHVLQELNKEHPGASRMKALARSYLWWPGLDKCLEEKAKSCRSCQEVKNNPPVAPLHPLIWPTQPWKRVHIDFAGPFKSHMFLVVIDAHSKWPEVKMMQSTTSQRTIEVLRELFSSYGLPEQVVSDNGPQFVSAEFETFMRNNGIKHIRCAPYHPSSNGLAERFIQTFKKAMLAGDREGCDLKYRLCQFLLKYRSSPHTTTDVAPCELFLKRSMRTRLDMLKPDLQRMVLDQQAHQKLIHDKHARGREFVVGQNVMVRNLLNGPKWVSGVISERRGPLTYLVEVGPNQYWRRHVDHKRDKGDSTLREGTEEGKSFGIPDGPIQADSAMDIPKQDTNEPYMNDQYPGRVAEYPAVENTELPEPVAEPPVVNEHLPAPETGIHRYPQRQRRPPDRY